MLSSQGGISNTSVGVIVRQTIGQQSAIGNYKNSDFIVGQGFQQSTKMKYDHSKPLSVITKAYPNPFIDKVNFQFSSTVQGPINILLFDALGRLVFSDEKIPVNDIISIENLSIVEGVYFVKLTGTNFNYSINLLKSK